LAVRALAAGALFALAGASSWPYAAAPESAAIPIKIKVVSIHFVRIIFSEFDFTLVLQTRTGREGCRGIPKPCSPPRVGRTFGDLLERYSRK
jgi:hypothetical protein